MTAIKTFHEASKARLLDVFLIKTIQGVIEREERNKLNGHFFTDGQKVQLEIKEVASNGYQGFYGWTSIKTYLTKDGQVVKYVGSSPIRFEEEWCKVKGTVKHTEYKGVKETHLQRIKLI